MKKFIIPVVAVIGIAVVIAISALPDYLKSLRPYNKLVTYAKSNGFAIGIVTQDFNGREIAEAEIRKVEDILKRKIFVKYFEGAEGEEFAAEVKIGIPGFILIDGDGNLANRVTGELTAGRLVSLFSNLHTH